MARVLVNIPKRVQRSQVFEVKVLISHPMESGQRRDERGAAIPRDIINAFSCTYGGRLVLRADLFPAIAANPFFSFHVAAGDGGVLELSWTDDRGQSQSERVTVAVE